jgi:hypothetical protein
VAPAAAAQQDIEQLHKRVEELSQVAQSTMKIQASTAGGNNTFLFVNGQLFNGAPVKGQPYSAEAVNESTQVLADGNKIVNRSSTMRFRDSDGRERREESIAKIGGWTSGGDPAKVVFISDPVARMSYTLHTADRTAEKMSAPTTAVYTGRGGAGGVAAAAPIEFTYRTGVEAGAPEANRLIVEHTLQATTVATGARAQGGGGRGGAMAMPATAMPTVLPLRSQAPGKVENLGTQNIEGVMAEGTRTTTTIPAGQIGNERDINIVSESWYSAELQMVVMTKRSDPRTGESTYKLTHISRAEPPRSMFEVPGDYNVTESGVRSAAPRKVVVKDDQE